MKTHKLSFGAKFWFLAFVFLLSLVAAATMAYSPEMTQVKETRTERVTIPVSAPSSEPVAPQYDIPALDWQAQKNSWSPTPVSYESSIPSLAESLATQGTVAPTETIGDPEGGDGPIYDGEGLPDHPEPFCKRTDRDGPIEPLTYVGGIFGHVNHTDGSTVYLNTTDGSMVNIFLGGEDGEPLFFDALPSTNQPDPRMVERPPDTVKVLAIYENDSTYNFAQDWDQQDMTDYLRAFRFGDGYLVEAELSTALAANTQLTAILEYHWMGCPEVDTAVIGFHQIHLENDTEVPFLAQGPSYDFVNMSTYDGDPVPDWMSLIPFREMGDTGMEVLGAFDQGAYDYDLPWDDASQATNIFDYVDYEQGVIRLTQAVTPSTQIIFVVELWIIGDCGCEPDFDLFDTYYDENDQEKYIYAETGETYINATKLFGEPEGDGVGTVLAVWENSTFVWPGPIKDDWGDELLWQINNSILEVVDLEKGLINLTKTTAEPLILLVIFWDCCVCQTETVMRLWETGMLYENGTETHWTAEGDRLYVPMEGNDDDVLMPLVEHMELYSDNYMKFNWNNWDVLGIWVNNETYHQYGYDWNVAPEDQMDSNLFKSVNWEEQYIQLEADVDGEELVILVEYWRISEYCKQCDHWEALIIADGVIDKETNTIYHFEPLNGQVNITEYEGDPNILYQEGGWGYDEPMDFKFHAVFQNSSYNWDLSWKDQLHNNLLDHVDFEQGILVLNSTDYDGQVVLIVAELFWEDCYLPCSRWMVTAYADGIWHEGQKDAIISHNGAINLDFGDGNEPSIIRIDGEWDWEMDLEPMNVWPVAVFLNDSYNPDIAWHDMPESANLYDSFNGSHVLLVNTTFDDQYPLVLVFELEFEICPPGSECDRWSTVVGMSGYYDDQWNEMPIKAEGDFVPLPNGEPLINFVENDDYVDFGEDGPSDFNVFGVFVNDTYNYNLGWKEQAEGTNLYSHTDFDGIYLVDSSADGLVVLLVVELIFEYCEECHEWDPVIVADGYFDDWDDKQSYKATNGIVQLGDYRPSVVQQDGEMPNYDLEPYMVDILMVIPAMYYDMQYQWYEQDENYDVLDYVDYELMQIHLVNDTFDGMDLYIVFQLWFEDCFEPCKDYHARVWQDGYLDQNGQFVEFKSTNGQVPLPQGEPHVLDAIAPLNMPGDMDPHGFHVLGVWVNDTYDWDLIPEFQLQNSIYNYTDYDNGMIILTTSQYDGQALLIVIDYFFSDCDQGCDKGEWLGEAVIAEAGLRMDNGELKFFVAEGDFLPLNIGDGQGSEPILLGAHTDGWAAFNYPNLYTEFEILGVYKLAEFNNTANTDFQSYYFDTTAQNYFGHFDQEAGGIYLTANLDGEHMAVVIMVTFYLPCDCWIDYNGEVVEKIGVYGMPMWRAQDIYTDPNNDQEIVIDHHEFPVLQGSVPEIRAVFIADSYDWELSWDDSQQAWNYYSHAYNQDGQLHIVLSESILSDIRLILYIEYKRIACPCEWNDAPTWSEWAPPFPEEMVIPENAPYEVMIPVYDPNRNGHSIELYINGTSVNWMLWTEHVDGGLHIDFLAIVQDYFSLNGRAFRLNVEVVFRDACNEEYWVVFSVVNGPADYPPEVATNLGFEQVISGEKTYEVSSNETGYGKVFLNDKHIADLQFPVGGGLDYFTIDTTQYPDGDYTFTIRVWGDHNLMTEKFFNIAFKNEGPADIYPPSIAVNLTDAATYSGKIFVKVTTNETGEGLAYLNDTEIAQLTFASEDVFELDTLNYTDGLYILKILAKDTAGNEATLELKIYIDNSAIGDTTPPNISTNITAGTYSGVVWVNVSSNEVGSGTVYLNNTVISSLTFANGSLVDTFDLDTTEHADGTYVLLFEVEDEVGNEATLEVIITIQNGQIPADNTPPEVSVEGIGNGTVLKGNVSIKATIADDSTIASAQITFTGNGASTTFDFDLSQLTAKTWTGVLELDSTKLPNGNHTVTIVVKDSAGNEAKLVFELSVENAEDTDTGPGLTSSAPGFELFVALVGLVSLVAVYRRRN